jgi:uncharacterized protein YraI
MKKCFLFIIAIIFSVVSCALANDAASYQYAQVVTEKGPLNMRETASTQAAKIDDIPNGTILPIVSRTDTWCSCVYNGRNGYVMTKFLRFMDVSQFRTLSQNDSGQDVLALKEQLQALYFYAADAKLTDQYDAGAETAVKLFQSAQGMEETVTASPELQAFLYWGPAKNNLPTKKMTVTISCDCSNYNHVGNSWSEYFSINGVKVASGDKIDVVLGETITIYSKITESDKKPDAGSAKDEIEVTQAFFDSGYTLTQKVGVTENGGRYSGNTATWTVIYKFLP